MLAVLLISVAYALAVARMYNVAHEIASVYTTCGRGVVPNVSYNGNRIYWIAWAEKQAQSMLWLLF